MKIIENRTFDLPDGAGLERRNAIIVRHGSILLLVLVIHCNHSEGDGGRLALVTVDWWDSDEKYMTELFANFPFQDFDSLDEDEINEFLTELIGIVTQIIDGE